MTQYAEFMEEFLEPRDKQKVGRRHKLLDEIIYPFNSDYLGYMSDMAVREKAARFYQGPTGPDYHWWLHFDTFSMWSKEDMHGLKKSACNL